MADAGQPLPYVREMADKVLKLFSEPAVRDKANQIVETVAAEDQAARDNRTKSKPQSRVVTDKSGNVDIEHLRRGKVVAAGPKFRKGWPFPVQHGIEELPGCVLVAVAINNYASEAPEGFDPAHKWVGPENPPFLVSAVEKLTADNESTLRRVIDGAVKVLFPKGEEEPPAAETPKETDTKGKPRGTVNQRMAGEIMKNPEAMGWNSTHWSKHLKCVKSTIVETATWKKLESARLQAKAEQMKDRRRKPKASDTRRN